jgi:hypothetical protein
MPYIVQRLTKMRLLHSRSRMITKLFSSLNRCHAGSLVRNDAGSV